MKRREFIKSGLGVAGLTLCGFPIELLANNPIRNKFLFLIELRGGNDGLNTLVPLQQYKTYKKYRPQIGHDLKELKNNSIQFQNESFGLHPILTNFKSLFENQNLSFLTGVGVKDHPINKSHFEMIEVWNRGDFKPSVSGWNTEILKSFNNDTNKGYCFGSNKLGPLIDSSSNIIKNFDDFKKIKLNLIKKKNTQRYNKSIAHVINTRNSAKELSKLKTSKIDFSNYTLTNGKLSEQMKLALNILNSDKSAPIFKFTLGSFDTHTMQISRHESLLMELDQSINGLIQGLKDLGIYDQSVILTYSEFGRNPRENKSGGTDHGTSSIQILAGGAINGGNIYGQYPDLTDLINNKDLKASIDFRNVYSNIAYDFFKVPKNTSSQSAFLSNKFNNDLGFIKY